MHELPDDAWQHVARCLTGTDLFELARTSRAAWRCFSHDDYWRHRLAPDERALANNGARALDSADARAQATSGANTEKESRREEERPTMLQRYWQASSFQFDGLATAEDQSADQSDSSMDVTKFVCPSMTSQSAFTFDVWFSLSDTSGGGQNGSTKSEERHLVVSADKQLYCSVTQEHPASVADLELHRWYHLALAFNDGAECVYVDGELVRCHSRGESSPRWNLQAAHIGDGLVSGADGRHLPTPDSSGWYPLNGAMDAFRFWNRALSSAEIQALARGGESDVKDPSLRYSLKRDITDLTSSSGPSRICCTRPRERVVRVMRVGKSVNGASAGNFQSRVSRTLSMLDTSRSRQQQRRLDTRSVLGRLQSLALAIAALAVGLAVKAAVSTQSEEDE